MSQKTTFLLAMTFRGEALCWSLKTSRTSDERILQPPLNAVWLFNRCFWVGFYLHVIWAGLFDSNNLGLSFTTFILTANRLNQLVRLPRAGSGCSRPCSVCLFFSWHCYLVHIFTLSSILKRRINPPQIFQGRKKKRRRSVSPSRGYASRIYGAPFQAFHRGCTLLWPYGPFRMIDFGGNSHFNITVCY